MDTTWKEFKDYRKTFDDFDDHVAHVKQFLTTCVEKGFSLHSDKYTLSQDGCHVDKSSLNAVSSEFSIPTSLIVNSQGKY